MVKNSPTSIIKTLKYKLKIFIHFLTPVEQQVHQKELCFRIKTSLLFYLHFIIMTLNFSIMMFIFLSYPCLMFSNESSSLVLYVTVLRLCKFSLNFRFYAGDMLKLKDDCKLVRPTIFIAVPRIFNRIVDKIQDQFKEKTGVAKCLIETAVQTKS